MVDWNMIAGELMTQLLKIIIPLFVVLLIKWGLEVWCRIRETNPDFAKILQMAVSNAVMSAEQIYGTGEGQKKKEYAIQAVQSFLAEKNIYLDVDNIIQAIEAAVYSMHRENFFLHREQLMYPGPQNEYQGQPEEDTEEEGPES